MIKYWSVLTLTLALAIGSLNVGCVSHSHYFEPAPEKHTVIFENEKVRVLEVVNPPGGVIPLHTHSHEAVTIIADPAKVRIRNSAGEIILEGIPDGGASWYEPNSFPISQENIDTKPIKIYKVELIDTVRTKR
tara:strand:- start:393 stop:791 length:399 start_codon:yes stop_codon:yes gene_type:complete